MTVFIYNQYCLVWNSCVSIHNRSMKEPRNLDVPRKEKKNSLMLRPKKCCLFPVVNPTLEQVYVKKNPYPKIFVRPPGSKDS